jgi:Secretion system C-terminal sorting domain
MKKVVILLVFIQSIGFAQEIWRPLGNDDFNSASCGDVTLAGRNPIVVKNDHAFLFNIQTPEYQSTNYRFSASKYSEGQWQHLDFPFFFPSTPIIDCAVDSNEIPYVLFNAIAGNNAPVVKKFENGNWTDVGTDISTLSSSFLNIAIGSDNLPRILFREGNVIKLKKFDGSNWVLISETTEFIPYTSISLELDNNNIPYVVSNYQVGSTYNCFVKKFNGTAWEEVGITGFSERGFSLVFDNFNVPHMFLNNIIKRYNGLAWENIPTQLSEPYFGITGGINLFFNNSNELYASFAGAVYMSPVRIYVRKLVGTTWQSIVSDGFIYDKVYTVSGNNTYHVSFGTDYQPDVYKINNGVYTLLGPSPYLIARSGDYDFSICNGIPLIAYQGSNGKAQVGMLVNDNWSNLGALNISENEIYTAKIKSGTDGNIYLAYNNRISSTTSDTKLSVKKLTSTGWELVGPVNFSLSAGYYFDFKMSHTNEPYVLYMSGRVQKFDGSNWVFVGGSAYVGDTEARLVLDANDLPYIAFKDPSNGGRIAVKKLNGNVWEYVDQTSLAVYTGQSYNPRIVIDALNNIYLGFIDNTDKVHIKKLNNGSWESVGPDFFTTGKTRNHELSVDQNNVLYVLYNELENNFRSEAKVKKFNGSNWEFVGEPNFSATSITQGKIDFWANNTPIASFSSANGTYHYIYAKYFGEMNALGINEQELISENPKWLLYPNPVTNDFSIVGKDSILLIEIFDMTGKKVKVENSNFNNVDISSFRSGIYMVKVKSYSGSSIVKLVKN